MSDSCPVCNSISITFVRSYRGNSELFRNLELKKCNNCTFVFADPLPKDEELDKYNSSYFVNAHGGLSSHPMATAYQAAINKIRVNYVIEMIQKGQDLNLKILEIGPGTGDFLKFWLQRFPNSEYSILESDLINRERFKGLVSFQYSSFKEIPSNYFDLIIISHVLEHTNDPKRFLNELSNNLKNAGFIFIEVPCQDYLFKDKEEPHLLFFNKESMNQLFNKINMRVINLGYFGPSIIQSFYKKNIESNIFESCWFIPKIQDYTSCFYFFSKDAKLFI
uniref:Methyltransferase type 12 n=1 Tax=Leptospira interrogans serovar Grippotyphosa TaxID=280498 RepID=D4HT10_LEPIR|nr:methyltransferase type 12 [Leptospira interrogans serovar Grippotyphosa]